ncbi:solute carrier family 35 member SLC35F1/F2/F6 [Radiomyces spectabilis]|uniref:solute carrier family 35 member SLC35F1/F2/F6 n=1 Tax=Radiomyces spectabilis TaxID=64574 RepID=UPI00221EC96B|nr:solute carrier family 35 member SLC35F1/F2/F6 [Radiomyces spectabilis]KAI8371490.1 solute carrier family 35 member SLC35F1/F2/F6 [Radiomyces spectabilis]
MCEPKKTWKSRFAFLKDPKFLKVLFLGQLLSLCITGTNVTTTKLGNDYNFAAPTTQTFLVYACLALVYNSFAIYKRGIRGWLLQFWRRGIYYFILGLIDVEGNYFVVKSYQYTSLLSAMLLDCWSTPVCMILSFLFLKVRYKWVQYVGVFIALCGLGMLVGSDVMTDKNYAAADAVKGDLFCLLGATLYGFSNVGEEIMARKHPLYEVIGMFTFFATFINFVQLMILERSEFASFVNQGEAIAMVIVYTCCMFVLYSLAPVMFRLGSAVLYNLSLLTSDFYGLIFGLGLFGYKVTFLYPIAYVVIIIGIAIYHIFPAPEPAMGTFTKEVALKEKNDLFGVKPDDPEQGRRASSVMENVPERIPADDAKMKDETA